MSDTPSNPATGNGTRQQPGNVVCRHCPIEPVAALAHVCKHCGVPIEAVDCVVCDGIGLSGTSDRRCPVCRGTGIDRWEVET